MLVFFLGGCSFRPGLAPLVVSEQRTLEVREPAEIVKAPLPQIPEPATVSRPAPTGDVMNLTLDEAIRISLKNSQVVRVLTGTSAVSSGQTIYDPAIANTAIDAAKSVFDPVITARNLFNRSETPVAGFDPFGPNGARIGGTRVDNYEIGLGISKKLVTGGTLSVDGAMTNDRFTPGPAPLNPQERSALTLALTQPLLQGAGIDANISPILVARINTERSYFQFKDSVQGLVRGTIEAYWQVVFARTDVWARRQQVEQGAYAFALADTKFFVGFGTEGEVAQAKLALTNFRAALVGSEANLLQREAALRNILGLPPTEPERFVPTTPPTPERFSPKWGEIVNLAAQMRPDLIELALVLEADQQNIVQANNQALPKVDATTFYRWNGLEGQSPSGVRIAAGPSDFTDWTVGVNFSVPLGLRKSRATLRNAELVLMADRANLDQARHAATHALAANVRNLAQYYEQYLAFRETRIAARVNLEQQAQTFRVGKSIFLNVLQAITSWGDAVSAEAQALAQYNIELANLEKETGTILETHGIRFMEERFGAIGPLGRLAHPRQYPMSLVPGPNADHYPSQGQPAEKSLEREVPSFKDFGADPAPPAAPFVAPPPARLPMPAARLQALPNARLGRPY
jgi:outer membrane protein TolC